MNQVKLRNVVWTVSSKYRPKARSNFITSSALLAAVLEAAEKKPFEPN
jgi:hypothetical protein